ncbi:hypothetical protein [Xylella taiwanensis]|uniref:AbiTii domain-containing protein n=1 Tax=Xylella taiwanensis TaxID=1444770 RepID=UPI001E40077A|nr:hypothetical protein [Xylella taiwanensis]MCD8465329.1 hypothetical protein [Xylella taiwanensis]MCD8467115.1 hypothetical protein [Xylella taiwanensis]UFN04809.1 hypothetical protein LPH41_01855 [Xylella taiwanensis]
MEALTGEMSMDESKVLVNELVDAVLDRTVSLAHLLRLALVAASRLELPALAAWIKGELNGYPSDEVPDYRRVLAPFIAKDPVKGFVPLNLPPDISKEFAQLSVIQSIHELGQFAQRKTEIYFALNPEIERSLMEIMRLSSGGMGRPLYLLSNEKVHEILEKVRDKVLQWVLDLETQGVLGKGRIFSVEEKQIVKNYRFNFGDVKNSNVQIGTIGSNQTHIHTADDMAALLSLIECLRTALEQGAVSEEIRGELQAYLMTLQEQAISSKPEWPIIKRAAQSMKAMFENAAGNVIAAQIMPYLTPFQ